jgi:hypothetical protein
VSGPLDKLHDFYQPPPPARTPQTIGWYVLFAIAALIVLWLVIHSAWRWLRNRYRREALHELELLPAEQFSTLLKRTALTVWPREKVASLSGDAWLEFLSSTAKSDSFGHSPGNRLEEIALRQVTLSDDDERALRAIAAEWIRRHRVPA